MPLLLVLGLVGLTVALTSVFVLYRVELANEMRWLDALAAEQAHFIEAVAAFDAEYRREDDPDGWFGAILAQVRAAHAEPASWGRTGSLHLVTFESDSVVYLLAEPAWAVERTRARGHSPEYTALLRETLAGWSGNRTIEVEPGDRSLVAFHPVNVPDRRLALTVAKSVAEVRGPFLTAGLLLVGITVLLTGVGGVAVWRIAEPTYTGLERSERRLREVFDAMREGFALHEIIRDDEGHPVDYRFLEVNPAFRRLTGLEGELIGRTALEVIPDLERDWIERYGEVVRTGEPVEFEMESQALGRWYHVAAFRPQPGQFAVTFLDLTERRVLEAQLRQAQKMEAVGQLTGGIAHDFNNFLGVILMNAELLTSELEAGRPIEPAELGAIRDAAMRANSVTRQLLGYSRRAELVREPTDLKALIRAFTSMLRTVLPETITLDVDADGKGQPVLVDRGSVEQIVMNLTANARDAMPDGGSLRITVSDSDRDAAPPVPKAAKGKGRFVAMEVADTGSGMDPETLEKVFDPFFTTKALGVGTGLGMAMVYGLIRQQEGHITIDSRVGVGTTIRLFFPVIASPVAAPRPERPRTGSPPSRAATILVVEDETTLLDVTRRALERAGHTVFAATDAGKALDIYREHQSRIDLVLSDLVLPGPGGLELRDRLRSEFGPIRFVLASGYGMKGGAEEEWESVPVLQKPWLLADLLAVVRDTLEQQPI